MAYEKTVWQTGDIVTSTKLNKIENQLEACDGKILVAEYNEETGALNKTWQEIYDAMNAGGIALIRTSMSVGFTLIFITDVQTYEGEYVLHAGSLAFDADSANGYPVATNGGNEGGPK